MLVTFKSKASAEIMMLPDTAKFILNILGKDLGERGVITAEQIPAALVKLETAVEATRAAAHHEPAGDVDDSTLVRLDQRAWPVIEMLRASLQEGADITWAT